MKPELVPGRYSERQFVVAREHCPHFDGLLRHPVCATWTLVHEMEVAGRKLLEPFLEDDEDGIGAHISIDHRSPAAIGASVVVRAEATVVTRRKLVTRMSAVCGERLLAEGTFVQIILAKARLREVFAQHGAQFP